MKTCEPGNQGTKDILYMSFSYEDPSFESVCMCVCIVHETRKSPMRN